jgi:hypothetical protein
MYVIQPSNKLIVHSLGSVKNKRPNNGHPEIIIVVQAVWEHCSPRVICPGEAEINLCEQ